MLNSIMRRHILNEDASEIDNLPVQVPEQTPPEVVDATKNTTDIPETVISVDDLQDDGECNPMIDKDTSPIVEAAIELCSAADEMYLLTENTICKMRIKAVQLSALLEDASASADEKAEATDSVKKLNNGAIKTVLVSVLAKLRGLIEKFSKFIQNTLDKLNMFKASLTKWVDNAGLDACKAISDNQTKMTKYKYSAHNWTSRAIEIEDTLGLVKAVNTLFPEAALTDSTGNKAKALLDEFNDFTVEDFKRKLLKTAGFDRYKAISIDEMKREIQGGEPQERTGITPSRANDIRQEVSELMNAVIPNANSVGKNVLTELNTLLKNINSFKATGTQEVDQILTQYASKRASVITIAISLATMVMSVVIMCARDRALEYMKIVNDAGKFANRNED